MRARQGLRRPTRPDAEVALRAAVGAGLAIWVAERAGLADPYWAGISAVVAAGPTVGANLTAALSRVAATLVGLALGLAAVAVSGTGVLVAGVAVFIALLLLPALSLDRGARLGAATTLIVTALPSAEALDDALARGLNIPLGCAVAVALGFLLLPKRAGDRLREGLRDHVEATGALARSALETYAGRRRAEDLAARLRGLQGARATHATLLGEALREPGERGERAVTLRRELSAAGEFVDEVATLAAVAEEGANDRVPELVRAELLALGDALARAAAGYGSSRASGQRLAEPHRALAGLQQRFAAVRARRGTAPYETDEVIRLTMTLHAAHGSVAALDDLRSAAQGASRGEES
jgi:uncharacterized membrane protein YccC